MQWQINRPIPLSAVMDLKSVELTPDSDEKTLWMIPSLGKPSRCPPASSISKPCFLSKPTQSESIRTSRIGRKKIEVQERTLVPPMMRFLRRSLQERKMIRERERERRERRESDGRCQVKPKYKK